jgi:ribosomal protein L30E
LLDKPQKKVKDEELDFLPGIPFSKFVLIGNNNTTKEAIDTIKNNKQNDILLFAEKPNQKVRNLSQKIIKILPDIQVIEYEGGMVRYGKLLITNDETEEFNSQSLPEYLKIDKLSSGKELDFIKNSKIEVDNNNGIRGNI